MLNMINCDLQSFGSLLHGKMKMIHSHSNANFLLFLSKKLVVVVVKDNHQNNGFLGCFDFKDENAAVWIAVLVPTTLIRFSKMTKGFPYIHYITSNLTDTKNQD